MVKDKDSTVQTKKKRKSASAEVEPEVDVYQTVCQYEEEEAKDRDLAKDSKIYYGLLDGIEELVNQIFEAKKLQEQEPSEEIKEELNYNVLDVAANICGIKKLNRLGKLGHVDKCETLAKEKQKCDSIVLSYENLLYELQHLVKETGSCLSFKSDDEVIELVPFKEFIKQAPTEVTSKFTSGVKTPEEEHALKLARLEWELTQRKSLADECQVLEEKKKKIIAGIAERQDKLDNLLPLLNDVVNATIPLQEHLSMPGTITRKEHALAAFLPCPLYTLYSNIVAYKTVYETSIIEVSILGDKDEAILFNESHEEKSNSNDNDDSDNELPEFVEPVKTRRHRKSVQQVDPIQEKKRQLLEPHPLRIQLKFTIDQGPVLNVNFSYRPKLKLATVESNVEVPAKIQSNCAREILTGHNILSELLPKDTGLHTSNPRIGILLRKSGLNSFETLIPEIGYAYQWTQSICGLNFLTQEKPTETHHIEDILKLIRKRLYARNDLANQMQQLEKGLLPKVPEDVVEMPEGSVSALAKWLGSTFQEFCSKEGGQSLVDDGAVGETDLFYLARITRDKACLLAHVVIKNSYPIPPPIFSLTITLNKETFTSVNDSDVRDLERTMNLGWNNLGPESSPWLLGAQLAHLCAYFDVYLEISNPSKGQPSNAKYIKRVSGRNQRKPFNFRCIGSGVIFTQY